MTITGVDATAIDIALTEPFAIAKGAPAVAANVLVEVRLSDGTIGLGEAAPFTAVSGETQAGSLSAVDRARSWLMGQDARRFRPLGSRLGQMLDGEPSARCALEMAVLDALTRYLRLPLWAFFGGQGAELETDMTITAGDARHAATAALAVVARGIHALKVKVGALSPREDADRLEAVHRAAPGARLTADANGGYTPLQAMQFLEELHSEVRSTGTSDRRLFSLGPADRKSRVVETTSPGSRGPSLRHSHEEPRRHRATVGRRPHLPRDTKGACEEPYPQGS
jgi:L-alanine-DL-glutamate epimerase-like enolase superfamily enzyme